MAARISDNSLRKAAIDCSTPSGRRSASIWLVMLIRCRSSEEKSGPGGRRGRDRHRGRHGGGCRRRAARRHRPGRRTVEFVLARSDFRDREIERGGAERRRGAIDLGGGALDHLGLALLVLRRGLPRRLRVRDLRQPGVEPRDGVVQLAGDAGFAARRLGARRVIARRRARNLLDLAGNGVQPLVNVGDIAGFLARQHRLRIRVAARTGRRGFADGGIEPVAQ